MVIWFLTIVIYLQFVFMPADIRIHLGTYWVARCTDQLFFSAGRSMIGARWAGEIFTTAS